MQPPFLVQVSALLSNAPGLTTLLSDNANDTYVVVPLACAAFADLMDLEGAEENQPHLEDDSDVYKYPPFPMNWTQQIILGRTPERLPQGSPKWDGFYYANELLNYLRLSNEEGSDARDALIRKLVALEVWLRDAPMQHATIMSRFCWFCAVFNMIEAMDVGYAYQDDVGPTGQHLSDESRKHLVFDVALSYAPEFRFASPMHEGFQEAHDALPEQFRDLVNSIHYAMCSDC